VRLGRPQQKKVTSRGEPVILFGVGSNTLAVAASAVDEIRSTDGLTAIATGALARSAKVKYTLERNGQRFFVVDSNLHFHVLPTKPARVMVFRKSEVALLVDRIDRITEISVVHSLPLAFTGEERDWYRGLALIDGDVVPVVDPASFLSSDELQTLHARYPLATTRGATA